MDVLEAYCQAMLKAENSIKKELPDTSSALHPSKKIHPQDAKHLQGSNNLTSKSSTLNAKDNLEKVGSQKAVLISNHKKEQRSKSKKYVSLKEWQQSKHLKYDELSTEKNETDKKTKPLEQFIPSLANSLKNNELEKKNTSLRSSMPYGTLDDDFIAEAYIPTTAFVCNKGGTGKTTCCVNIAGWLSKLGKKVLVIDLDPQASATTGLGLIPQEQIKSSADALNGNANINDLIFSTPTGIDVIPAHTDLLLAERELVFNGKGSATLLKKCLEKLAFRYDHIFIDAPAGHGLLSLNAVTAAQDIILPLDTSSYATEASAILLSLFKHTEAILGTPIKISSILIRQQPGVDINHLFGKDSNKISKLFEQQNMEKPRIFHIPYSSVCERAVSAGMVLADYAPLDRLSRVYQRVAKYIISTD